MNPSVPACVHSNGLFLNHSPLGGQGRGLWVDALRWALRVLPRGLRDPLPRGAWGLDR